MSHTRRGGVRVAVTRHGRSKYTLPPKGICAIVHVRSSNLESEIQRMFKNGHWCGPNSKLCCSFRPPQAQDEAVKRQVRAISLGLPIVRIRHLAATQVHTEEDEEEPYSRVRGWGGRRFEKLFVVAQVPLDLVVDAAGPLSLSPSCVLSIVLAVIPRGPFQIPDSYERRIPTDWSLHPEFPIKPARPRHTQFKKYGQRTPEHGQLRRRMWILWRQISELARAHRSSHHLQDVPHLG
ncbi:hypothetical protein BDN71DRAFT_1497036 [Pleurotus eryngii]|uniref:Uncharacterized protein n=1 Tax=Pleurotus eryngii TaxID=5323 RepID=A0A9P6DFB2_PLEER|nr:hypothetical protein BDN71DRAFT_1497036 [Pleurotus eryngii]